MSWLFEHRLYYSALNGTIVAERVFGVWKVYFKRATQTSSYTNAMWAYSLTKIPDRESRNVLVLGLGGGGLIKELHERFPNPNITAVEFDPTMIEIAKKLKLYTPYPFPTTLEGDANEILDQLDKQFDLIIVDLFDQNGISSLLLNPQFGLKIKRLLSPSGVVLVNFSNFLNVADVFTKFFPYAQLWHFKANTLGNFSISL